MAYPSVDMSGLGAIPGQGMGQFAMPPPQTGGMFGGGRMSINLGGALAGYLAGSGNRAGEALLQASNERNRMALEEQIYEHRQNLEMQRQLTMLPIQAQIRLMYPDSGDAQTAYQAGLRPGTPEWTQHMMQIANNQADPLTMIPGGGMAPASVARAMMGGGVPNGAPPVGAVVDDPRKAGGPASQAPGGFLGAPYAPIDGYNRY